MSKEKLIIEVTAAMNKYWEKHNKKPEEIKVSLELFINLVKNYFNQLKVDVLEVNKLTFAGMKIIVDVNVEYFEIVENKA